jgi:DNA-binding SARP family transcriptional activator
MKRLLFNTATRSSRPTTMQIDPVNCALFCDFSEVAFLSNSLATITKNLADGFYLVTDYATLLPEIRSDHRISVHDLGLKPNRLIGELILSDLVDRLQSLSGLKGLVVDMTWCLDLSWGGSTVERWGGLADQIALKLGISIVSLYNQEMIVEDQMQAAFRVHRQFLAPSGCYDNPCWVPQDLLESASPEVQLRFLLGRIVPDFADRPAHRTPLPDAARGATPAWLPRRTTALSNTPSAERWHVHCLGRLRVYINGKEPVKWRIPGSSPRKSQALFAYLLNRGVTGAHVDEICEYLWPDGKFEEEKRTRLHHTISTLRKTLGMPEAIRRSGDYYNLGIPQGSWIDVESFEQLCRRGLALFRHDELSAALRVYQAAERLYEGDLFEDLPHEFLKGDFENWCLPKRAWLKGMAVKLHYDMSKVFRRQSRLREAGEHSQKALQLDPTDEYANLEMIMVFQAQNRPEAVMRHYRQFMTAMEDLGINSQGTEVNKEVQRYTAAMNKL